MNAGGFIQKQDQVGRIISSPFNTKSSPFDTEPTPMDSNTSYKSNKQRSTSNGVRGGGGPTPLVGWLTSPRPIVSTSFSPTPLRNQSPPLIKVGLDEESGFQASRINVPTVIHFKKANQCQHVIHPAQKHSRWREEPYQQRRWPNGSADPC